MSDKIWKEFIGFRQFFVDRERARMHFFSETNDENYPLRGELCYDKAFSDHYRTR